MKSVFCAVGHRSDEDAARVAAHVAKALGWRLIVVYTGSGAAGGARLQDDVALRLRDARTGSELMTELATEFGCDSEHRYWLELGASSERLADVALAQDAHVFVLGRSLVRAGFASDLGAALKAAEGPTPVVTAAPLEQAHAAA